MSSPPITLEDCIRWHLDQMRGWCISGGLPVHWRHPQLALHREAVIRLIRLRRLVRRSAQAG